MSHHPLEARGLSKSFRNFCAVDHIDFHVAKGECLGLLGPNGAGKTTTIRMVTSFTPITSGEVLVFGQNIVEHAREVKAKLGICPQEDNLDPDFSVEKNLLVYARYFGIPKKEAQLRAKELLAFVDLEEKAKSEIIALSGGMKRRLVMARALINRPKLLVMDEPTTGLDPVARLGIWQRLRKLKQEGVPVLLTSHYMEEVSQLCDRVIMMNKGKIVLEGKPHDLVQSEIGKEVVELWNTDESTETALKSLRMPYRKNGDRLYLYDSVGGEVARMVVEHLPRVERLVRPASLEDVFLKKTGQALQE